MSEPALFPEPEPEPERTAPLTDGPWAVAPAPGCWRYMILGEDGQFLMIEGHGIHDDELVDVVRAADVYVEADEPADAWGDVARRTWAVELKACPDHAPPSDDCACCGWFANYKPGEGGEWWDWRTEPDAPADANRDRPGYFPVTVIDLEG